MQGRILNVRVLAQQDDKGKCNLLNPVSAVAGQSPITVGH